jgi:exodeoxyribonuclease V alpha subunit
MSLLAALWNGGWLRAVDHGLAQSLRRAHPEAPDYLLAAAALASRALAHGHSALSLARVEALLAEVDVEREPPELPALADWLEVLRASPCVHVAEGDAQAAVPADRVLVLQGDTVSLRRYWQYETRLAQALRARLSESGDGVRLRLVTGGPGTGKTTQVASLLANFLRDWQGESPPRIALAAPTGKAASRLEESVRESLAAQVASGEIPSTLAARIDGGASTLHRLLGWQRDGFRHGLGHSLPHQLVVVDEASMIDLALMCRLVEAVAPAAQLVIVGDPDQLPSVDTGDVLAALCEASEQPGSALRAARQHLSHPHRQSPDVDVPQLAALVREGAADALLRKLDERAFRGVQWRSGNEAALHALLRAEAVPAYRALADAPSVEDALRAARGYRVLCALREGPFGAQALNALVGAELDPAQAGEGWYRGRLVLITENSYRQQLFNGDIGVCWPDEDNEMRVWFDGDGGPRPWLPAALPAHEPAFALTVHKAQGSEFERVLLALPEHDARVLSRELLYTGLTRCKREVTLWGSEDVLRSALGRRAARWSGLARKIGSEYLFSLPAKPAGTQGELF